MAELKRIFFRGVDKYPSILSLLLTLLFLTILCLLFELQWETNDDVGMSMIAHGYGLAAVGTPNILYSNVLWGNLIRAIPEIHGVLGYSIATLCMLFLIGWSVFYSLLRLKVGVLASFSILLLVVVRPILFPQFTVISGLLLVSALLCWHLHAQKNDWQSLIIGCLLALCSYWIRDQEFLLVLFVALPLLPWRALRTSKRTQIAFLILILAILFSAAINHQAYKKEQWDSFNALNLVRASFTDFGVGENLKKHPEILARNGYSSNDVNLIRNWFFVDPSIANPQALKKMLADLGPLSTQTNYLTNAWGGVKAFFNPRFIGVVLLALLLLILKPRGQILVSWSLCIVAVFCIGLLGRPGVLRIYEPLVALLLVAPFLSKKECGNSQLWRNRFIVPLLILAALVNTQYVFWNSKTQQDFSQQIRQDFALFPKEPVVIWAANLPYEAVYPVFKSSLSLRDHKLYALGVAQLAPFSVAYNEQESGRGITQLLTKEKGVPFLANTASLEMLAIYCHEHLHGELKTLSTQQYGAFRVNQERCIVK